MSLRSTGTLLQVVSIDGQATIGWNGDQAAQLLRGRTGSSVSVKLARRTQAVPGVPARPEPPLPRTEYKQVPQTLQHIPILDQYPSASQASGLCTCHYNT